MLIIFRKKLLFWDAICYNYFVMTKTFFVYVYTN